MPCVDVGDAGGLDGLAAGAAGGGGAGGFGDNFMPSPPRREAREKELKEAFGQLGDANEVCQGTPTMCSSSTGVLTFTLKCRILSAASLSHWYPCPILF